MSVGYLKKCVTSAGYPKRIYATQKQAEAQRFSMIRAGKWTVANSNTYFCNIDGGYHAGKLGTANRGGGRKAAKNKPRHLATQ